MGVGVSGGIGSIGWTLRQGEAGFLLTVIRPIAGLAIIPAVWMLLQTIPLNTGLTHPIWLSAEQALGYRISGSISVNPGATLLALGQYVAMLAGAAPCRASCRGPGQGLLRIVPIAGCRR